MNSTRDSGRGRAGGTCRCAVRWSAGLWAGGAAAWLGLATAGAQLSDLPRQDFWVTDGLVFAVVETNGVVYVGGEFNSIAPNGGRGTLIQLASGASEPGLPQVNGAILAVVPDGDGGWFVGGQFNRIGGVARTNLARIRADQTVDPGWGPNPFGYVEPTQVSRVHALLLKDGVLYVGGIFTNLAGVARSNLAAVDPTSALALPWNGVVQGEVYCLASAPGRLFLGGTFTSVEGSARTNLAAVDPANGSVLNWAPHAWRPVLSSVNAFASDGNTLFVGGYFDQINGVSRPNLAAVDMDTAAVRPWGPWPDNGVQALAFFCDTLYAGGAFTNIGGFTRRHLAAVDPNSGQLRAWNPDANAEVYALGLYGNTLLAGGLFTQVGGETRNSLAAIDLTTGQPTPWAPRSDRGVLALGLGGGRLFAGGGLSAGGVLRRNLAAFDAATGRPLAWNPGANGRVRTIAVAGDTVYLGGRFDSVAGVSRRRAASVSATTGLATAWDPDAAGFAPDTEVFSLAVNANNTVYAGGLFTRIGAQTRICLAALNHLTGQATSWNPNADGVVFSVATVDDRIYVGGTFTTFALSTFPFTISARSRLAEFTAASSVPTSWNPGANGTVVALAVDAGTVYAGGYFSSVGGAPRSRLAAIQRTGGAVQSWNPGVAGGLDGVVSALALTTNRVYVGGNFASVGGLPRNGVAEVDKVNGIPTAWAPVLGDLRATVLGLAASTRKVTLGGAILTVGDEVRSFVAEFHQEGFPRVLEQPESRVVDPGQPVTFSATATGAPPLAYQWQFNGVNLPGATNDMLTFASAGTSNSGVYRVIVTNSFGQVSSLDAVLTVVEPATIAQQPTGGTLPPGTNLTLSVDAGGNPPPAFQWRRNGVNIPGAVFSSLTLTNIQPGDSGSYSVVVDNGQGAVGSDVVTVIVQSPALPLADEFGNRGMVSTPAFTGSGSNGMATRQIGEPLHAGRVGGASVWLEWEAPASGLAVLDTRGSTFDTLLAVYTGAELTNLVEAASDDDRGGYFNSQVAFQAVAGTRYAIAVDGLNGARGHIVLSWSLDTNVTAAPRIVTQPLSQTVSPGATALFQVGTAGATNLAYQWFYNNCVPLPGATGAVLVVSNVQAAQVGLYSVRITNAAGQFVESLPAFLEIGPFLDVLSRDKIEDLFITNGMGPGFAPAIAPNPAAFIPVTAGIISLQLLNNIGATAQPGEANHCGILGGASKWLWIRADDDGLLQLDTLGSAIDTVMAAYRRSNNCIVCTYTNPVACNNDLQPGVVSQSRVAFHVTTGEEFYVAIDGVKGVQGHIQFNWRLGTPVSLAPPPSTPPVRLNGRVAFAATVTDGYPAPQFQWFHNGAAIPGATNAEHVIPAARLSDAGQYSVIASNLVSLVSQSFDPLVVDPDFAPVVLHAFGDGAAGWQTAGGLGALSAPASGGNPGGHLRLVNAAGGSAAYWVAPLDFLGNQSLVYGGWLEFDLRQSNLSEPRAGVPDVILSGAGELFVLGSVVPPRLSWISCRVPIDETRGWSKGVLGGPAPTREELLGALAALAGLHIRADYSLGPETNSLDNVAWVAPCTESTVSLRARRLPGGQLLLEWPLTASCFGLEGNDRCAPDGWQRLPAEPPFNIVPSNGMNTVTVPAAIGRHFFRLRKQ